MVSSVSIHYVPSSPRGSQDEPKFKVGDKRRRRVFPLITITDCRSDESCYTTPFSAKMLKQGKHASHSSGISILVSRHLSILCFVRPSLNISNTLRLLHRRTWTVVYCVPQLL